MVKCDYKKFREFAMDDIKEVKVIDLFCGVGGLTHGLKQVGFDVVAGYDIDETCRYAYEENNKALFINQDIRNITANDLNNIYRNVKCKVLVGCAPCQPFSTHSNKLKKLLKHDDRWNLLNEFLRLIKEVLPDIISMENVPQLTKTDIFKEFVNELDRLGYFVKYSVVFCPDYGLPQSRRRLVLLASRYNEIKLLPKQFTKENYKTVKDAIAYLKPIHHGESSQLDPLHKCSSLSNLNYERILASKANGTWRDWDSSLLPNCYKKESGQSFGSVYGRMSWDKPSPTITTQFYSFGTGRFGHPSQNRALSIREGAILQGFPIKYKFAPNGNVSIRTIARHIGNAVPVVLGNVVGESIKIHLRKNLNDNSI